MRTISSFLILVLLAACTPVKPASPADSYNRTRPADCVPLPATPTRDPRRPTATPNPLKITFIPPQGTAAATVTPWPTPLYTDISPTMKWEDKMEVWVYRCDGTKVLFLVDPDLFPTAIPLKRGDIILDYAPPTSIMGKKPPEPPTSTATPFQPIK